MANIEENEEESSEFLNACKRIFDLLAIRKQMQYLHLLLDLLCAID